MSSSDEQEVTSNDGPKKKRRERKKRSRGASNAVSHHVDIFDHKIHCDSEYSGCSSRRGRGGRGRRGRIRKDRGGLKTSSDSIETVPLPTRGKTRRAGKIIGNNNDKKEEDAIDGMKGATKQKRRGGRGRYRSRSRAQSTQVYRMELTDLTDLAKLPPCEVVYKIYCGMKGFQESLQSCSKIHVKSKDLYIATVIDLLFKICEARDEVPEEATMIIAEFLSGRCSEFQCLLKSYVCQADQSMTSQLLLLFQKLVAIMPSSALYALPIDDLSESIASISIDTNELHMVTELKKQCNEAKEHRMEKKKPPNICINEEWDNSLYRTMPILPTIDEICSTSPPRLRSNIINGAYTDWEHYYDIQFRLLREDFLAPLRRGILQYCSPKQTGRLTDIYVYNDVRLTEPEFTESGLCFKAHFDVSQLRQRKNLVNSKRLIFGSLLCFSPKNDRFQGEIYFSTVSDRKPEELPKGIFHVHFENNMELFQHIQKTHFTVIESRAYFEASRHILHSLQTAETTTMPFKRYLIENKPVPVNHPSYLQCDTQYNISWLYPTNQLKKKVVTGRDADFDLSELSKHTINITDESSWPSEDELELDASQINAIRMALTQEISVIQGPPGTGKTYIGYKIVQTLLQNRLVWDPHMSSPILVMCYTNHALDQFLEGIIHHRISMDGKLKTPNIVRVGGRSKSEDIKKCSLFNARKRAVPYYMIRKIYEQKDDVINTASKIKWNTLQRVIQNPINEFIISNGMFLLRPVIYGRHYYQLVMLGREKLNDENLALEVWLGFWDHSSFVTPGVHMHDALEHNEDEQQHGNNSSDNETKSDHQSKEEDDDDDDDNDDAIEKIDVTGEAEIEESNRRLDDDAYTPLKLKENAEEGEVSGVALGEQNQKDLESEDQSFLRKTKAEINSILSHIRSSNVEPMEPEEEKDIRDVTCLSKINRYRLFKFWIQKNKMQLFNKNEVLLAQYEEECQNFKAAQQQLDRIALEKADVIGMTTTGAAKYQHILHLVKPKIVIVEEAAEVLESHIVSALNAGTQHLILIGDHKQLRPKPNEYDLAKRLKFEISLFERLLLNNLPHATLLIQHRMRPQISKLVHPSIYDELIDHETVKSYDSIRSFDKNMFFFNHSYPEREVEHLLSHSNVVEADFVVSLCRHFLKQGYGPSSITILTAYTGQLLCVRDRMPKKEFEGVQVVNVDNFQGEENDIIILSLVRSNRMKTVGFLKEENRVCVALSRARMGFYCFGNFDMLREVVPIWDCILQYVEGEGCLGSAFSLHCHNHPSFKAAIEKPDDFIKFFPEGGCDMPCTYRLDCGHQCKRSCHLTDLDHEDYKCNEPCERLCANGEHPCKSKCYKDCPPCKVTVIKTVPSCPFGHTQEVKCCEDLQNLKCLSKCPNKCENGIHDCLLKCWEGCKPCTVLVKSVMPNCGHEQDLPCHSDPYLAWCFQPCSKKCPNGHICCKKCYEDCGNCEVPVLRKLPKCGHEKTMLCYEKVLNAECHEMCQKVFKCKHVCQKMCYEECDILCREPVTKFFSSCLHSNVIPCYQDPKSAKCTKPCEKKKACGHLCQGQCGELCLLYECNEPKELALPCNHVTTVSCKDHLQTRINLFKSKNYTCNEPCTKTLQCGHPCQEKCSSPCTTKCTVKVTYCCPNGHKIEKVTCHLQNTIICEEPCLKNLPCGHRCSNKCHEECSEVCNESYVKNCKCGHAHKFKCGDPQEVCSCTKNCSKKLSCGHYCSGKCGECYTRRIHAPCAYDLQVNRFCGHFASLPCYGLTDMCQKPCLLSVCPHSKDPCKHECFKPCTAQKCQEKCIVECSHQQCTQICSQVCDKPACDRACPKPLQKCHHPCSGVCGDRCLKQCCFICNKSKYLQDVRRIGKKSKGDEPCVQLDCGHIYTVRYLDQRFASKDSSLICPLTCPACSKPFFIPHYWKLSRERAEDISQIKQQLFTDETIDDTDESKMDREVARQLFKNIKRDDSETRCVINLIANAMQLLINVSRFPECDKETLAGFISSIVKTLDSKGARISTQIIYDIESEFFRFSLLALAKRIYSPSNIKQPLHSLLQQMDEDHNLRLTYEKYEEYLPAIHRNGVYEVVPVSVPKITKGEWYKCRRAGHIYFVPAIYQRNSECTECRSSK
ncbi:PREDICTED: NFX1-type zinc finger-containing protein 1-like [Amphimedon queenslandica]|uniref:NF-X1-type domain-containing protein n=1 Tax=Amphimedon queenslandica TaxID=400682 RepID=A0AAN0J9J6_AMPQE|nr:PREDICTED: NFX1-type zinc finger-containing protein 1-like [Amphimedon queenslandica]|eukprot:XP_019853694.1 PREDICTED: NFX1-type zinc finger-containing protein 1-like [Amphimedon queenslandica]